MMHLGFIFAYLAIGLLIAWFVCNYSDDIFDWWDVLAIAAIWPMLLVIMWFER